MSCVIWQPTLNFPSHVIEEFFVGHPVDTPRRISAFDREGGGEGRGGGGAGRGEEEEEEELHFSVHRARVSQKEILRG